MDTDLVNGFAARLPKPGRGGRLSACLWFLSVIITPEDQAEGGIASAGTWSFGIACGGDGASVHASFKKSIDDLVCEVCGLSGAVFVLRSSSGLVWESIRKRRTLGVTTRNWCFSGTCSSP